MLRSTQAILAVYDPMFEEQVLAEEDPAVHLQEQVDDAEEPRAVPRLQDRLG